MGHGIFDRLLRRVGNIPTVHIYPGAYFHDKTLQSHLVTSFLPVGSGKSTCNFTIRHVSLIFK
jgi:hypothetical protein